METKHKERFVNNVDWFNHFFNDLKTLFDKIAKALKDELSLHVKEGWQGYYYPKGNFQPSIPSLYMTGLRTETYSVQVFAILDPSLFENNPNFSHEPSLVVVKHSRPDRSMWINNFGLRFIRNHGIERTSLKGNGEVIAGKTSGDEGAELDGFQILFDEFGPEKNVDEAIKQEVVDVLKELEGR